MCRDGGAIIEMDGVRDMHGDKDAVLYSVHGWTLLLQEVHHPDEEKNAVSVVPIGRCRAIMDQGQQPANDDDAFLLRLDHDRIHRM